MIQSFLKVDKKKIDTKQFELPVTTFVRDIDNHVFQSIAVQCISQIEGVSPVTGGFWNVFFGKSLETVPGIIAEQDEKKQSVKIRMEINVVYGFPIPEKTEELQNKISSEITKLTGLHVSQVHVVIKNVIPKPLAVESKNASKPTHKEKS